MKPIRVPTRPGKAGKTDYNSKSVNYVFKPPKVKFKIPSWPSKGITRAQAVAHCRKVLVKSKAGRACKKVVNLGKLKTLQECIFDIKVKL